MASPTRARGGLAAGCATLPLIALLLLGESAVLRVEAADEGCLLGVLPFATDTCNRTALWYASNGWDVFSNETSVTGDPGCTAQTVVCTVETSQGTARIREVYNHSALCTHGLTVTQAYSLPVVDPVTNQSSVMQLEQTQAFPYTGYLHWRSPVSVLGGDTAEKETLRVNMRGGTLTRADGSNVTGWFGLFEHVVGDAVVFHQWLPLSRDQGLGTCNRGWLDAGYTLYTDDSCLEKHQSVQIIRPDGYCQYAVQVNETVTPRLAVTQHIAALCEDDRLYFSALYSSGCSQQVPSTHALKKTGSSISLASRGVCLQTAVSAEHGVRAIKFDSNTCEKTQPECVWKKQYLSGRRQLLKENITMADCLQGYKTFGVTVQPCALSWVEAGLHSPVSYCQAVLDNCVSSVDTTEELTGSTEWGCLIHSDAGRTRSSDNEDNLILQILLVVLAFCCIIFVGVLVRVVLQYKRRLKTRPERGVQDIDSGRTDGVVHGVPVPAERLLEHEDDDDECSAAPGVPSAAETPDTAASPDGNAEVSLEFQPDPNITSNPLEHISTTNSGGTRPSRRTPPPGEAAAEEPARMVATSSRAAAYETREGGDTVELDVSQTADDEAGRV
eukprot:TRINITY_DN12220_c0_g1_i1.p1 TRINITY_DN12220_c0_g1~~TRINITY_DN12220_c0_g1_i1.p1  ORF type:complete len:613 (+),score=185.18 TRINITY_DN12220_c0_g1_i1:214-2052(+)